MGVVKADFDAAPVDASLAQGTLFVPLTLGQAEIPHAHVSARTSGIPITNQRQSRVIWTALGWSSYAAVSRIWHSVPGDSAESGRTRTDRFVGPGRALGVGSAGIGDFARVVTGLNNTRRSFLRRSGTNFVLRWEYRNRGRRNGFDRLFLGFGFDRIPSDLFGHFNDDSQPFAFSRWCAWSRLLCQRDDFFFYFFSTCCFNLIIDRIIQSDQIFLSFFLLLHEIRHDFDSLIILHPLRARLYIILGRLEGRWGDDRPFSGANFGRSRASEPTSHRCRSGCSRRFRRSESIDKRSSARFEGNRRSGLIPAESVLIDYPATSRRRAPELYDGWRFRPLCRCCCFTIQKVLPSAEKFSNFIACLKSTLSSSAQYLPRPLSKT